MNKRAFQALDCTFIYVSGLPSPCFGLKNYQVFRFFFSKFIGGRPETCINVRFRP